MERLGLRELSERVSSVGQRHSLGLSVSDCLSRLEDDEELRLLEINEQSAGGMHGPWQGDESKLWMALCSVGITPDATGRGGSYGYGKAGLIRGSAIRLVIAYTCFAERPDDPGVTRRLLGRTYWDRHRLDGTSYTGAASLGNPVTDDAAEPLENAEADRLADRLGMTVRDPAVPADLGTTLLLVEPTVDPPDLITAVERYWWPALHEPGLHFHVQIVDEGGEVHYPQPRSNPDLRPFIDAYEIATTPQDNRRADARRRKIQPIGPYPTPGTLGMRAENPGWSYPEYGGAADTGPDHRSLIALVRKPRMVVEYYEAGLTQPFIRGTFVADESINEPLRRTEPKAHDAWQTRSAAGDVPDDYAALARGLLSRIKNNVNSFRNELKPKPKPAERLRLPEFDRIMRLLLSGRGSGKRPPPSERRPFSIHPGGLLRIASDGRLYLTGTAIVEFSEHHLPGEEGDEIEVSVRYKFMEDDRPGDRAELDIDPPPGFTLVSGRTDTFRGRLAEGSAARFDYLSEEYDPGWTGKLFVDAELVEPHGTPPDGAAGDEDGDGR